MAGIDNRSDADRDAAVAAYGAECTGDEPEYGNVNDSDSSFFGSFWGLR